MPSAIDSGPYGCVSYQLLGREHNTKELAVCLHGLNGSKMLFSDLAQVLSRSRMVLTYDMYGHGLSNAPPVAHCIGAGKYCCKQRAAYDLDFFVDQLYFLMDYLKLIDCGLTISLIGFSFGGAVAISFVDNCPWCIIPLAQHCACSCIFARDKFVLSEGDEPLTEAELEWQDMYWRRVVWQTLVKRDGISSSLAIVDRVPFFDMTAEYARAGEHPRPVLLIWGVNDQVNPLAVAGTVPTDFQFRSGKQEVHPLQQETMNNTPGASTTRSARSTLRVKLPHARDVFIPRHEVPTLHRERTLECDIETNINRVETAMVQPNLEESPTANISNSSPRKAHI
ncbi:conserved hypothetical protein [Perkinsus marinus ATCC 50983]|uniref:AB hydrolase-1 domain-containing protein n=1 Tax=Perkinsus marinus (strain ATCC 50983 / TXsc) TaxID=423536 RepID=C5KV15_PERM5|nr:conserved hypothetical protein [Perkinsus marinus ATCC 50983]EER11730.1 conserved hypothetical protein [Perkinsus marinus ATCC 50983]|eukprot:XP_002779935.1 conserved hypothetical protein [Perkinsus marinus ATCC 50983]